MATIYSSVRIVKFNERSQLRAASAHALRHDAASKRRRRPDATSGVALAVSTRIYDGADTSDFTAMRDVEAAFDAHLARHHIEPGQGAGRLGFHAMIAVSPGWVSAAGGDPHDQKNPRNQLLLRRAVRWIESWCGENSMYCARLDLDEAGAGVVDVFVAPWRKDGRSRKVERRRISTSKALTELRQKHNKRMSYVAMQTDLADFCRKYIDPEIRRGRPKVETGAEHLEVEEYKEARTEAGRRLKAAAVEYEEAAEFLRTLIEKLRAMELTVAERQELDAIEEAMPGMRR